MQNNHESNFTNNEIKAKFELQKVYIKEISCKVPQAPGFFVDSDFAKGKWDPSFSIEMHIKHQAVVDDRHEVVLQATAIMKSKENTTALMLEVQQAGLFLFTDMTNEQISHIVKTHCPAVLYPFLSRAIADASVQAGFPALLMPMPNLEQGNPQKKSEAIEENEKVGSSPDKYTEAFYKN